MKEALALIEKSLKRKKKKMFTKTCTVYGPIHLIIIIVSNVSMYMYCASTAQYEIVLYCINLLYCIIKKVTYSVHKSRGCSLHRDLNNLNNCFPRLKMKTEPSSWF